MESSSAPSVMVAARHTQNVSAGAILEPHWGYNPRTLPCTSDAGTCEYLDLVYSAHDNAMLYSGIMWAVAGGLLFMWALCWRCWPSARADNAMAAAGRSDKELQVPPSGASTTTTTTTKNNNNNRNNRLHRFMRAAASICRARLLPDSPARAIFGRTTRLQVLILAILSAYLIVFSFAGMTYRYWITPAKKVAPGVFTIRSTLGPWSNRVGILAYALTPFSVLLATRESILSLLTGVPYQSFNFLHRWLGYIIFAQSLLHTIGWIIIEVKLYQPQPFVPIDLFSQLYMHWGILAMFFLLVLFVLSLPRVIRLTGYEFFRKAHYVLAMVFIGACYGHWDKLSCFMVPGLVLWFVDRAARLVRSGLMHYHVLPSGRMGFTAAQATLTHFPDAAHGDVVRLDLTNPQDAWEIGKHFYLCFAELSIWQSHPFTPLNLPEVQAGTVQHSYIFRAKKGETKKMAALAAARKPSGNQGAAVVTPVILSGSYGACITENLTAHVNVLAVAGGTGITYVLPVLLDLMIRQPWSRDRRIELLWVVRRKADVEWVRPELDTLLKAARPRGVVMHIHVTREAGSGPCCCYSSSPSSSSSSSSFSFSSSSSSSPRGGGAVKEGEINGEVKMEASEKQDALVPISAPAAPSSCAASTVPSGLDIRSTADMDGSRNHHPDLATIVDAFVADTVRGSTTVFASGPAGMISDLRAAVAGCNSGSQVWKGNERFDVRLVCDDRLEW